jgi:hypothetical protein
MKNPDEKIDRVLAALREAEASEGMERRILEAMRDGASARCGWSPLRLVMPSHLIGTRSWAVAAAIAVVSLAACWTVLRQHRIGYDIAASKKHMVSANAPAPKVRVTAENGVLPLHGRSIVRLKVGTSSRKAEVVREGKSAAPREIHAENHSAPEAPLTEEEKLLLRIAHQRGPEEVAALSPVLRAAWAVEEKAEFQRFFEPVATGDNE